MHNSYRLITCIYSTMGFLFLNLRMVLRAYLIFDHVINNSINYSKFDKIELRYSRGKALKLDSLRPAKGVKEFLWVSVQTWLVSDVDRKRATRRRDRIRHVTVLWVICHEPLEIPKRNPVRLGRENILQLFGIYWIVVKFCERREQKFRTSTH